MIREIVAVGIGGALGSMSRYLVSYVWLAEQSLLGFPAGTFTVNAAGSLLMGFLLEMLGAGTASWLLSVGFCGGFTTFSTFSSDVVRMLKAATTRRPDFASRSILRHACAASCWAPHWDGC